MRQTGNSLTIGQIVDLAKAALPQEVKIDLNITRVRRLVTLDDAIVWVGQSTYGLAEWNVGLSAPAYQPRHRRRIADEIEHLLRQAQAPVTKGEVMQHIKTRFRVSDGAVQRALTKTPHFETNGETVRLRQPAPDSTRPDAPAGAPKDHTAAAPTLTANCE